MVPLVAYGGQAVLGTILYGAARVALQVLDPGLIQDEDDLRDAILQIVVAPLALLSSLLTLGLVYASVCLMWRRPFLDALRIRRPGAAPSAAFALLGAAVAAAYVAGVSAFPPPEDEELGGPLTRLAESGPEGYAIWMVLAVLIAPVVEEVLFRGYVYLGARRALGPLGAGAAVTAAFTALHLGEAGGYWPAMAGILLLAAFLAFLMERTGNLSYCIGCHFGYNLTLAVLGLAAQV